MIASRKFLSQLSVTDLIMLSLKLYVKLLDYLEAITLQALKMSSLEGAGTRMFTHLDLIGGISLCILEQTNIILQFFMYISMVLLRAPWAYLVSF